jgi:protein TonB
MKYFFLLLLGITVSAKIKAQEAPTADTTVLLLVENMPEFPGGSEAMMKFISSNIRYPKAAIENSVQGRVVASFIVNTDGSLSDIKLLKKLDGVVMRK